jgi:glycerophosphoryl diester phosphodiesterase
MPPPPLYAHRFGRAYGPDSSRRALDRLLDGPVDGLETDCCLTRDGDVVLLHDPFLPHAVGEPGWAHERGADEIVSMRLRDAAGRGSDQRPLRLAELLGDRRVDGLVLQLEVKAFANPALAVETAAAVCRAVRDAGTPPERIEVIGFWPGACERAAAEGFASRMIVAGAYAPEALAGWARERGVSGVILEAHYFSRPVVESLRDAGVSVMSGVVNDAELARVVLPFEPDAIATDRPQELRRELEAE